MNKTEVAQLLTLVSAFDSRTVGIDTVEAWHPILAEVDVTEAATVVRNHFATSTAYMMPAHIIDGLKQLSGPKRLQSDVSFYCEHHWPTGDCERCKENN